ncbi:hypothetical protein CUR178_02488 [Leishmania enriettii]|uniref:C2HC/C3H-type domain-containing protein n=1 Tax=Leishmania enriettii TaxID=5663 RepID=A0A836FXK1_LEIEN|nr:hypothetical protein CUR178_02488 [Leishmania enriettii]
MSTTRRSTAPNGLSSNTAATSRRSRSLSDTVRSSTYRGNTVSSKEGGRSLIVTRGLQELLDKERKYRRLREAAPTAAAGGKSKANRQRRRSGEVPNFVICYLCGRQFGTASIDIHRPQCYLKRLIVWERGDPATRGPKPISPADHEKAMKARMVNPKTAAGLAAAGGYPGAARMGGGGLARESSLREVELYNQLQMSVFTDATLSPCLNCGRTFLPDRLQVHLRSCKPGKAAKPIRTASCPTPLPAAKPSLVKQASAVLASAVNRPTRAAGAHAVPTAASTDDVPPAAAPSRKRADSALPHHTFLEVADLKGSLLPTATSPSWRLSGVRGESSGCVLGANAPGGAAAAAGAQGSDVIEVEVDMDVDDTDLRSRGADSEHRLSSVAVAGAAPGTLVSSVAKRATSREPSAVPPLPTPAFGTDGLVDGDDDNDISCPPVLGSKWQVHVAGSRPRGTRTPSGPRTAGTLDMAENDQSEGFTEAHVQCTSAVTYISTTRVVADGKAEWERDSAKKIQLNNVSHFKNVSSRLNLQRRPADAKLVACKYCGRTFLSDRVQRHESCCIDRNKPLGVRTSEMLTAAESTDAVATKRTTLTPAAPAVEIVTAGKAKFCGGCGSKASAPRQKFCSECGYKL